MHLNFRSLLSPIQDQTTQLLVAGANGQLGRLVIDHLLEMVPSERIVAMVRREEAAGRHAARNVRTVIADYDQPGTLDAAVAGIDRVLLISSNDLARRVAQHRNVIDAARRAGVGLLAYASILHADASPLGLAAAHRDTEDALRASGVPFVLLRNGWYSENYAAQIPAALAHHGLPQGLAALLAEGRTLRRRAPVQPADRSPDDTDGDDHRPDPRCRMRPAMTNPILHCVHDPLCGWCYAAEPLVQAAIQRQFDDPCDCYSGQTEPLTSAKGTATIVNTEH